MTKIITTLCIIHQHPKILLGMKKRSFGVGRWNGFGGKVLEGETLEDSLRREFKEEAGVEVKDLEQLGVVDFELAEESKTIEVNIFKCKDFKGEPVESEEMRPEWFFVDEIPFSQMWPTDVYWMPLFLKGKKFRGKIVLDKPSTADYTSAVISKDLFEVEEI